MSLLFVDSFDHYDTDSLSKKWNSVDLKANDVIDATGGRDGGGAYKAESKDGSIIKTFSQANTIITGFRYKSEPIVFSDSRTVIRFKYLGDTHIYLVLTPDGSLTAYVDDSFSSGGDTVLDAPYSGISMDSYVYIECKATIHSTSGVFEVRVDGVTVINATGVNTVGKDTSVEFLTAVEIGGMTNGTLGSDFVYYDDFYICNTDGTVNNDFLGDIKVEAVLPTADGANTDLTPLSGTDHFAMVDDNPPNDDTDYNHSSTSGHKDTYVCGDIPVDGNSVLGVQVLALCRKEDAGARNVKLVNRPGVTDYASADKPVSVNYSYAQVIEELNQDTGSAWTEAEVNSAEYGIELA